ncbi:MAG: Pycsar system effector family protein [Ferruginibacter sp.]
MHLFKKTEQYITGLYEDNKKENLLYHNLDHTRYVVDKVKEIAGHYQLNEKEMHILVIAAWFHDSGYLVAKPEEHEEKGVELMKGFLDQQGRTDLFEEAAGCIMATKPPHEPVGILQQIICDADTYNFGTKDFKETNKRVFSEMNYFNKDAITKIAFDRKTYEMLVNHKYFTSYCQELLQERKTKQVRKIKEKVDEFKEDRGPQITEKDGTTKGMQTMLRLTSSNHIQLSEMADSKANILISVNAIIISLILSILLRKLQTDPFLTIPTILFLSVAVITIVIAILATRPKVTLGTFSDVDILNKKTNLLFFGNFHKVDLNTYEKAMRAMMKDSDYLYRSIIKDIYFLGVVLGKKYKLLRLAYNIFMIGIILSVIAFAIASMMYEEPVAETGVRITNSSGTPF